MTYKVVIKVKRMDSSTKYFCSHIDSSGRGWMDRPAGPALDLVQYHIVTLNKHNDSFKTVLTKFIFKS